MKLQTFIKDNIKFDEDSTINPLNKSVKIFNDIGNFFLSPARHLFHGKSVSCVVAPIIEDSAKARFVFAKVKDKPSQGLERLCKTVASVLLLIPGTIIGSAIKGVTLLASNKLERRYERLEGPDPEDPKYFHFYSDDPAERNRIDANICLFNRDAKGLYTVLDRIKKEGNLDEFIKFICEGGSFIVLQEYQALQSDNRQLLGGILRNFAEGEIKAEEFFNKMKQLNDHVKDDPQKKQSELSKITKPSNTSIRQFEYSEDLLTRTSRIRNFLRERRILKNDSNKINNVEE